MEWTSLFSGPYSDSFRLLMKLSHVSCTTFTMEETCITGSLMAFALGYSIKVVFLIISQSSHENNCGGAHFLINWQAGSLQLYQERLQHRCFPVNFAKCLRTPFCIISENGCSGSFKKFLFNKISTYQSEFRLSCSNLSFALTFLFDINPDAQPNIFQGMGGFVKLGHFDKHYIKSRKKTPQGKIFGVFSLRYS